MGVSPMSSRGMGNLPMFEVLVDFDRYSDRISKSEAIFK
jgi:hypothetical protein